MNGRSSGVVLVEGLELCLCVFVCVGIVNNWYVQML